MSANPLLEMDPFSLELMADPLPFYKALRDNQPVRYYEEYDTYFFSRFDDVWEVLRVGDNVLVATETNLPTPQYLRTHRNAGAPPFASPRGSNPRCCSSTVSRTRSRPPTRRPSWRPS